MPQLDATFDLTRLGDAVKVSGTVRAKVGQTCVVTLEPIENEVSEEIDLLFSPPADPVLIRRLPESAKRASRRSRSMRVISISAPSRLNS